MSNVLERFPRLSIFGELRSEVYHGKPRVFLAASPTPLVQPPAEDRADLITRSLLLMRKRFLSLEQEVPVKVEENIDIEKQGPEIITGCRCFCNKQISEICSAFEVPAQQQGKSLPVQSRWLASNSKPASESSSSSTTIPTTHRPSSSSTTSTHRPSPTSAAGSTTTSTSISTQSTENATKPTENITEEPLTVTTEIILTESDATEMFGSTESIEMSSDTSATTIAESSSSKPLVEDAPNSTKPKIPEKVSDKNIDLNFLIFGSDISDDGIEKEDDDITVIYPRRTYQTIAAYSETQQRRRRSIIDTIPMLSEKQSKYKAEVEATERVAVELVALEDELRLIGEAADSMEVGEGVVGTFVQQIIQNTKLKVDKPYRTSKYADKLEELMETVPDRVKINFMLWKILEKLVVLPGYLDDRPHDSRKGFCVGNVYHYFPQYFLRSRFSYREENKTRLESILRSLQTKMDSKSFESVETSLRVNLLNIHQPTPPALHDFQYKTYMDQVFQLERTPENKEIRFLSQQVSLQSSDSGFRVFEEVNLLVAFFYQLISPRDRAQLEQEELALNITHSVMGSLDSQTLNVEHFGDLDTAQQFVIDHAFQSCSKDPRLYAQFTEVCRTM